MKTSPKVKYEKLENELRGPTRYKRFKNNHPKLSNVIKQVRSIVVKVAPVLPIVAGGAGFALTGDATGLVAGMSTGGAACLTINQAENKRIRTKQENLKNKEITATNNLSESLKCIANVEQQKLNFWKNNNNFNILNVEKNLMEFEDNNNPAANNFPSTWSSNLTSTINNPKQPTNLPNAKDDLFSKLSPPN